MQPVQYKGDWVSGPGGGKGMSLPHYPPMGAKGASNGTWAQAQQDELEPCPQLYVKGLPAAAMPDTVRDIFAAHGHVKSVKMLVQNAMLRGTVAESIALVTLETTEDAAWIKQKVHGNVLVGTEQAVSIQYAQPKGAQMRPMGGPPVRMGGSRPTPKRPVDPNSCHVYVKGLPPDVDDDWVGRTFEKFGTVECARCVRNAEGECSGVGFVRYDSSEAALEASKGMMGMPIRDGIKLYTSLYPDCKFQMQVPSAPELQKELLKLRQLEMSRAAMEFAVPMKGMGKGMPLMRPQMRPQMRPLVRPQLQPQMQPQLQQPQGELQGGAQAPLQGGSQAPQLAVPQALPQVPAQQASPQVGLGSPTVAPPFSAAQPPPPGLPPPAAGGLPLDLVQYQQALLLQQHQQHAAALQQQYQQQYLQQLAQLHQQAALEQAQQAAAVAAQQQAALATAQQQAALAALPDQAQQQAALVAAQQQAAAAAAAGQQQVAAAAVQQQAPQPALTDQALQQSQPGQPGQQQTQLQQQQLQQQSGRSEPALPQTTYQLLQQQLQQQAAQQAAQPEQQAVRLAQAQVQPSIGPQAANVSAPTNGSIPGVVADEGANATAVLSEGASAVAALLAAQLNGQPTAGSTSAAGAPTVAAESKRSREEDQAEEPATKIPSGTLPTRAAEWAERQEEFFLGLPKLPEGWVRAKARSSGKTYYLRVKDAHTTYNLNEVYRDQEQKASP